jgi:hypothetical protein
MVEARSGSGCSGSSGSGCSGNSSNGYLDSGNVYPNEVSLCFSYSATRLGIVEQDKNEQKPLGVLILGVYRYECSCLMRSRVMSFANPSSRV